MIAKRMSVLCLVGILVVSFTLLACAAPRTAPAPPQAPAPAQAPKASPTKVTKLKVMLPQKGSMNSGGIFAIAQEKGYLKEEGLEVEAIFAEGGGENVQVVVSRGADIGMQTGIASVLGAWKKGAPITIIAANDIGSPVVFWYVKADSPIKSWKKEFSGKKVGYSRPGSGSHMAILDITEYYKSQGWAPLPEAVSTGGMPDTLAATLTGQIDVGWTGYPVNMDAVEQGKIRSVFLPFKDLPGWDTLVVRVAFANNDFLKSEPDAVKGWLRAWKRAVDYTFSNTRDAFRILSDFSKTPMPSDFVISQFASFSPRETWDQAPKGSMDLAMKQAIMGKFIEKPLTKEELDKLFPLSYIAR